MDLEEARTSQSVPLIYCSELAKYDFGPQHPLRPIRLKLTVELISAYDLLQNNSLLIAPTPATEAEILTYHTPDYVSVVKRLSQGESVRNAFNYGFGYGDNPPFKGMYEASLLYTGASIVAADLVASGRYQCAFSISGGLHHALSDRASGFCIFNDAVIVIKRLRKMFDRVAYIDIDAHHGDGVQNAFYNCKEVLTISIHENGNYLFPGTGFVHEIGEGEGKGFSVNIPLMPGTSAETHVWAFQQVVPPLILAFNPDVIVAQLGADAHYEDPLAHLCLTSKGFLELVRTILSFEKPVVALGGGGYNPLNVARLWTLAYAEMRGVELPDSVPEKFSQIYNLRTLHDCSRLPEACGADSARVAAENTVKEIRRLIFPIHGIPV
jgi:acetoin utilization protein AcuC